MSRIELILCDGCGHEVEDGAPITTIMVPDEDQWIPLDLCGRECVLRALGFGEDQPELPFDVDPLIEELTSDTPLRMRRREAQPEGMDDGLSDEVYVPETKKLTPDELMDNEKRFKAQALEISEEMTGVRSRTMGRR